MRVHQFSSRSVIFRSRNNSRSDKRILPAKVLLIGH